MSDNVIPIQDAAHVCPVCQAPVPAGEWRNPLKHAPTCMQPEIRMRRAEGQLQELLAAFHEIVAAHNEAITEIQKLKEREPPDITETRRGLHALARHLLEPGRCLAPDGDAGDYCGGSDLCPNCSTSGQFHGDCGIDATMKELLNAAVKGSKNACTESPEPPTQRTGGARKHACEGGIYLGLECEACNPGGAFSDFGPDEPLGPETPGAVHPGEEPGRTGGPAEGLPRAPEGGPGEPRG